MCENCKQVFFQSLRKENCVQTAKLATAAPLSGRTGLVLPVSLSSTGSTPPSKGIIRLVLQAACSRTFPASRTDSVTCEGYHELCGWGLHLHPFGCQEAIFHTECCFPFACLAYIHSQVAIISLHYFEQVQGLITTARKCFQLCSASL